MTRFSIGYKMGTRQERERIIGLVEHTLTYIWLVGEEQHIPRLCDGCDFIALIEGDN